MGKQHHGPGTVSPKPKTVWNKNRPPRWTFENPAYKLHLTKLLPEALPDHPVTCWKAYKHLLIQAVWQTMNNNNNTQQDTLSLLFKLQKASALEALRIIESNKEVADLFDYYPPSPDQIHEAIAWVKTQLNIKIPKKRHTPFPEIPTLHAQMLDPITNNLTCNSKRKDEITKDFWAPLLGPISSNEEAWKALLSNYNKKLNPIPHLTETDIEAAILSCKSRLAPGPDGVTFAAWKALPKLSASILCNMFYWLSEHPAPDHFNDPFSLHFPKWKGPPELLSHSPSPPNTDNRIITKAMSHILNPLIAQLWHYKVPAQLFSKAYDNLDRNGVIHILEQIGMPQTWTTVIVHLMQNTEAYLPSGIHFPLDTLLMKLHDSPAKPKRTWTQELQSSIYIVTGAALNYKKTEVLAAHPPQAKDRTSTEWPVQTVTKYKYLGVLIGHISALERVEPMLNKAQRRAQDIIPKVLGLQRKIVATNIYIHSILQYQICFLSKSSLASIHDQNFPLNNPIQLHIFGTLDGLATPTPAGYAVVECCSGHFRISEPQPA
ncbi:hypothetical protein Pelo_18375 [Pelomyxa schiedti]|nr:hypothetical protein Pelo_18375 [Pelomyxa schiedti]